MDPQIGENIAAKALGIWQDIRGHYTEPERVQILARIYHNAALESKALAGDSQEMYDFYMKAIGHHYVEQLKKSLFPLGVLVLEARRLLGYEVIPFPKVTRAEAREKTEAKYKGLVKKLQLE